MECVATASGACLFVCLQPSVGAVQVEWLLWLYVYVKSMSAFTFHSSLTFCVTVLKGRLCFSGEHWHQPPVWPTRMQGVPPPEWQYSFSHPGSSTSVKADVRSHSS